MLIKNSRKAIYKRCLKGAHFFEALLQEFLVDENTYAPLAEGTLTGKYRGKRVPVNYFVTSYFGHLNITKERDDDVPFLKRLFSKPRECDTRKMEPLMIELESIAKANNKTIAQTAINWLITNPEVPVFPIPGMRNISQAKDNLEAAEWRMTAEERKRINDAELQCR